MHGMIRLLASMGISRSVGTNAWYDKTESVGISVWVYDSMGI